MTGLVGVGLHSVVPVGVRGRVAVVVAREGWHRGCDEHLRVQRGAAERHRRVVDPRVSLGVQPEGCRVLACEAVCLVRRGGCVSCQRAEGRSSWHRSERTTLCGPQHFARVLSCLIVTRWEIG